MDIFGRQRPQYKVAGMTSPVLCQLCGKVYDLTRVTVKHRYDDTTTFTTPCCGKHADDRLFVSAPSICIIEPNGYLQ